MKKRIAWLLVLILAGTGFSTANRAFALEDDQADVMAAVNQFYDALNIMFTGDAEPMKNVWSHADDITYMGPGGGLKKGWPVVSVIWEQQAALKLGGKVMPQNMAVTVGENMAVTSNYEVGENVDKEGNLQKVSIRATNIFRKEEGQWKMIGHHTDLLPYLENNTAD